ncbi:MAG: DNA polymerase III subunit delta [Candidatus Nealsonbacteria bacterium CG_4_10_14_0_8_um_filter_35_10]|uniref:DNA polymerase III subunit delta n=2 Tax=Candidatus Nealsoniibacteriota TaxID=1817911 RepID=A0A2M7R7G9_9BACT|nr:MAG: DNA polymerase III subunit delta [Candidatus Nealsonbacteria bacterium CG_4_10_14_0_8_um_filter_35_10]PJB99372.1 MAG: DNA polymerase III subunit delta [Candidatus Nealsonbacteria bacterium CG_4_9_14_0_8_um_filter_35_12]
MIIFLYGPDTYRSKQKLNEIIEHYKKIHKSGLSLIFFDFKEDSFEDFRDAFKSFSMFKEKKLMVLKNLFFNSKIENDFLKNLREISRSKEIILIYEEEIDENTPLAKELKKEAKFQKFNLLEGIFLKNWVKREFQKYSARIEPEALNLLLDFVGNDLWQMENEIKKLVNYSPGKEIKRKDIELLVKPKIETDIFKTIDAIAAKNKRKALFLMKEHLEKGDSPAYLLAMINFQFRNLLIIKSSELRRELYTNDMRILSEKLKMHPYVIRKAIQQSKKFSLEELKKIYQKIFQVDLGIKTGKIDPETALDLLIAEI